MTDIIQSLAIGVLAVVACLAGMAAKRARARVDDLDHLLTAFHNDAMACRREATLTRHDLDRLAAFPRAIGYEWRPDDCVPGHWAKKKGGGK